MKMAITPAVTKGPSRFWTDSNGLTAGTNSTASGFEGEDPNAEFDLFVSGASDDPGVTADDFLCKIQIGMYRKPG